MNTAENNNAFKSSGGALPPLPAQAHRAADSALKAAEEPPPFRAKYKTETQDPEPLSHEEPPVSKPLKRRHRYPFYYNNDFRLLVALALTAAVAAYIYLSMKGS